MEGDAWSEFVRRFSPVIAGTIATVARRFGHCSEDLVQELTGNVYLKLCNRQLQSLRNLRLEHENSLFGYMKLVASSVAYDYFRRHSHDLDASDLKDDLLSGGERLRTSQGSIEQVEQHVALNDIKKAVDRVTKGGNAKRDRAIFWLHYQQGFTTKAIAGLPGINLTQKGVESVLSRIAHLVRNELSTIRKAKAISVRI